MGQKRHHMACPSLNPSLDILNASMFTMHLRQIHVTVLQWDKQQAVAVNKLLIKVEHHFSSSVVFYFI